VAEHGEDKAMAEQQLRKILYVEDEPDIQVVARLALENLGGFTVKVCSSGKEALEEGPSFDPDLILMDVMMPELDGPSTFLAMREIASLQNKPAVFMTAKVQPQEIAEYKRIGAVAVISKPFDPTTLADEIRDIWQKSFLQKG